jgi:hypothetical protein
MARLEARSKLLYYPTPNSIVDLIAAWFKADHPVRLADPCCGTGEALRRFSDALGVKAETWGVELSNSRAAQAAQVLDHVLPTSFYAMTPSKWSSASVGLVFNNPPYDWSDIVERDEKGRERRVRHELLFVENVTRKIVPTGHQIIIVPRAILGDEHVVSAAMHERFARHVLGWYEQVIVTRFPDGEYERFKQVVVFAINKRAQYLPAGKEAIEAICYLANPETDIPILTPGDGDFVIPAAPEKVRFTYTPIEPVQLAQAATRCSPIGSEEYQRATYVRPLGASFTPALPLSVGHVTMLITGQETGVLEVEQEGVPVLVKGMSRKVAVRKERPNEDAKGRFVSTSVTEKERHEATLTVAKPDSALEMLADMESVGKFISAHAAKITDAILAKNNPLYDFQPTPHEWEITGKSALGLPPLPGRSERGLFPVQRHFAIGATRVMRKHGTAIMNCEMGFGKTSVSISSLELLDKWPAVIMVPGHMVWKWKRDVERSSNPAALIVARVITRPVLAEPGRWIATKNAIEAKGGTVTSLLRWQVDPITTNDPGGRLRVELECTTDKAGVLAALFAQYTFKDEGKVIKPAIQLTQSGLSVEYVDRDEYTLFDFVNDYKAGRLGHKAAAIIAFDPAKYDAGAEERPAVQYHIRRVFNEITNEWEHQRLACCPSCGHGYYPGSVPHFCSNEITEKVLVDGEVQERARECRTALFQMSRWRRVGLARLVQHKFRNFFKVYVADEAHKAQNGRSDIGTADQRLLSATRYSLALTGTLFGGTASSLFYLLYRRVPEIRRLYAFSDVTRWVDHYGLWERQWDQSKPSEGDYGASTNIRRWNLRQRELPGIAPAVIRYLLPVTLFGNITDLGYALPPVNEVVETLEMTGRQEEQYKHIERDILKDVLQALEEYGDIGGLSAWFSACRFRPASAFRDERIDYSSDKGTEIHVELPAVTSASHPWLPKETRLAEIVRENMAQGRKTLVFVEQSGTRDIRDRLAEALEALVTEEAHVVSGRPLWVTSKPRVGILSASDMSPAKREAWIKINAPQMDVLIVNPKLVETGLDLVQFSSLVFYETTVSLYTLWQAMRRVWRLGQDKEVNVTFLAYANTVEEEILRRMGQKKKAAQLLYGKEAAGVLVETDSDDVQREMIQAAIEGRAFRSAGDPSINSGQSLAQSLFSDGTEKKVFVSTEPAGSMVAASLPMTILHQEPARETVQMTLFGEVVPAKVGGKRQRR